MGDHSATTYKLCLHKGKHATAQGPALKICRTKLNCCTSSKSFGYSQSFTDLSERIVSKFKVLGGTNIQYSVYWQDEENEFVTIEDDEDLDLAINEMSGPVYKLYIVFRDDNEANTSHTSSSGALGGDAPEGKLL